MRQTTGRISRRTILRGAIVGLSAATAPLLAACAASPPTPTPPPPKPAAAPTQPPAKPTAAPTPVPAKPTAAPTQAPAKPAASPTAAAAPKPATTPTRMLTGEININLLALYTNAGGWDAVGKKYTAIHPGVKVIVDLKPTVSGYPEWLKAQFASGTPQPSLVSINYGQDLFIQGKVADFLLYLDKISPYTGKPWKDDFEKNAFMQPHPTTGGVYMLNTENYQGVWYYNKDAYRKAGIGDKPPRDWDELVKFGQALKRAGYIPFATEGDVTGFARRITWMHWSYYDQFTRSKLEVYRSKPGDWNYRKGIDDVWKLDVKDPNNDHPDKVTINGIRWWRAVRDKQFPVDGPDYRELATNLHQVLGPLTQEGWIGTADAYPLFVTQKAAMYMDVTSVLARLPKDVAKLGADAKPFDFGGFNFPPMTTKLVEAATRGREGELGFYGIPKKDQRQNDLEMDFMMYFSSPEGYNAYLQASLDPKNPTGFINGIPTIRHAKLPEELAKKFETIPRIGPMWQNSMISLGPGWGGPIQQKWLDLGQRFYSDKITLDNFVTEYQAAIEKSPDMLKANKLTDADLDTPEKRPPQR